MNRSLERRLEERSVGIYLPLALLSSIFIIGVLQIDAPFVGIFIAFWLVALCTIAAVATALVVLGVNARRAVAHTEVNMWAVVVAATIPVSLAAVLFVIAVEQLPQVSEAVLLGSIIMVLLIAPVGLLVTIFGDHARRQLRSHIQ